MAALTDKEIAIKDALVEKQLFIKEHILPFLENTTLCEYYAGKLAAYGDTINLIYTLNEK